MWDNSYNALCKILHYYKKGEFLSFLLIIFGH